MILFMSRLRFGKYWLKKKEKQSDEYIYISFLSDNVILGSGSIINSTATILYV